MPRFVAIDGLRAWMAWLVVVGHIVQQGLAGGDPKWWINLDVGGEAVNVFIIVSGFVITHLLIERPGGYFAYLIPRFMRLFPAFVVCSAIGGMAYMLAARWSSPAWFEPLHHEVFASMSQYLTAHVAAHLSMLHGVIPNTVLPVSEYAFDPPGWSVSLEWQFYLAAPLVIWLCRTRGRAVLLVIAVAALSLIYHHWLKAMWDRPSMLAGAAKFFLIGIGCRFAAPSLAGSVRYPAAIGIGLAFTLLWIGAPSLAVWFAVFSFILRDMREGAGLDAAYVRAVEAALESPPALWLAERSYSTYLLHWPILMMIGTVATRYGAVPGARLVALMLLAVPLTLLLQEPIYRFVERPGRAAGKRWARWIGARSIREVQVA